MAKQSVVPATPYYQQTIAPYATSEYKTSARPSGDVTGIYVNDYFDSYVTGSDPEAISGFSNITSSSVISTEQSFSGGKSFKDVSREAGITENANGFIHSLPSDLVEGDEAWCRMRIYLPIGSDLAAPGEGGHLKWLRWRTETTGGTNQGYADYYYDVSGGANGIWKFIKESSPNIWYPLAQTVGGPFDQEYGEWVTWEFYTRFHSTAGIIRMWKNGVPVGEETGIVTLSNSAHVVTNMYFRTYWNGGIPEQQDWYYGNVAIALQGAGRTDSSQLNTDINGDLFIGTGAP